MQADPSSQSSLAEETCPIHNELLVAFDRHSNKLACNFCIYDEGEDDSLTFTSYIASELKDRFDEHFNAYKQSLQKMSSVAPEAITKTIQATVCDFFLQIDERITLAQAEVVRRIDQSSNLKELDELMA